MTEDHGKGVNAHEEHSGNRRSLPSSDRDLWRQPTVPIKLCLSIVVAGVCMLKGRVAGCIAGFFPANRETWEKTGR